MTEQRHNHIPQEAFDWYDEYAHGLIDRRTFMKKLGGLVALGYSMAVLSSALLPNYALAEQVSFNDPDIKASYKTFDSFKGHGEGKGYLVEPTNLTSKRLLYSLFTKIVGLILILKMSLAALPKQDLLRLPQMRCTR